MISEQEKAQENLQKEKENEMAKETAAKKAEKTNGPLEKVNIAQGLEKAPASEVSGHSVGYYTCAYCGKVNWISNPNWWYFTCWNCGRLNHMIDMPR